MFWRLKCYITKEERLEALFSKSFKFSKIIHMKKLLICLIFLINFHVQGETIWLECDMDSRWKRSIDKLEVVYQEYFVVVTKETENQSLEKGAYLFDKDFGTMRKVATRDDFALKHIRNIFNTKGLNRETLYLEAIPPSIGWEGKCKMIAREEWENTTRNVMKETIKGNKF